MRVEVSGLLPDVLQRRIVSAIDERWRGELRARGVGKGYLLEKVLAWAEGAYADLINLEPTCVEPYEACDEEGRTIRRYAINEPPPPEPIDVGDDDDDGSDDDDSDDDDDDAEEGIDARVANMRLDDAAEREMRIKMKAEAEADRLYREQRRKEAEALNGEDNGVKPPSKKEQQKALEAKRQTQGKRLRKQGAKANKFDAEAAGHAASRATNLTPPHRPRCPYLRNGR